jgi:DNA primase
LAGVQNVVAPQGTAFTDQHARILKRYADEVVLCFDADPAGQNAAVRALDGLLESGLAVRVAEMPPPHDPDSFIKANGAAAFRQIITAAPDFFAHYLNRLCATNDTATAGRPAHASHGHSREQVREQCHRGQVRPADGPAPRCHGRLRAHRVRQVNQHPAPPTRG